MFIPSFPEGIDRVNRKVWTDWQHAWTKSRKDDRPIPEVHSWTRYLYLFGNNSTATVTLLGRDSFSIIQIQILNHRVFIRIEVSATSAVAVPNNHPKATTTSIPKMLFVYSIVFCFILSGVRRAKVTFVLNIKHVRQPKENFFTFLRCPFDK